MNLDSQANYALFSNNATWPYPGTLYLNNAKQFSKYFTFTISSYILNNPMK